MVLTETGWRRIFFIAWVYSATRGLVKEPGDVKSMVPPSKRSWSMLLLNFALVSRVLSSQDSTTMVWLFCWTAIIWSANCLMKAIGLKAAAVACWLDAAPTDCWVVIGDTGRRDDGRRRSIGGAPGETNRAWIAFEERSKGCLIILPFAAWQAENLDEGIVKDFSVQSIIRDILGIELVTGGLFVNSIKKFIHPFLVVFVLDKMLLD